MVTTKRGAKGAVRVTFQLSADIVAEDVAVSGDFNDWSRTDLRMQRAKNGTWRATIPLAAGRRYQYRYLLDGERWENDWHADDYAPNPYGGDDSVLILP